VNYKRISPQQIYYVSLFICICFANYNQVHSQVHYPNSVQVNSTTNNHQDSPEIAVNGKGTVVIVFESGDNGPDENIFAVSYDRQTFREFYRTGPTTDTPSIEAFADNEHFVVSWEQNSKIYFTIISCIDGNEKFIIEPKPVIDGIYATGERPDVAISSDDSLFVIGWHNNDIFMQFFKRDGSPNGALIGVNDVLEYKQAEISLIFFSDSTLVATWYSEKSGSFGTASKDRDIWFQLFDCKPVWEDGAPVALFDTQKRANGDLSSDDPVWYRQEFPEVDVFNDGRFVIMWQDFPYSSGEDGTDGSGKGAYFRIFNHDGTPQTDDLLISEHTLSFQKDADIRIRQSDNTIHFIYEDAYESTTEKEWLAYPSYRAFDDSGNPLIPSFEMSDKSYGTDCRIAITEADAEKPNLIVCVWETKDIENYDGSGRAVIFRDYSNTTAIEQYASDESYVPIQFELNQNYPNPFNPTTTIVYSLPKSVYVSIKVMNILGETVADLVNGHEKKGIHKVLFNGSNIASGVYFFHMKASHFQSTQKAILMK